jgi:glycerol-3-phosphate dehydrogenase
MTMSTPGVDVLVVGGGATGAASAYDLARRGYRVLLAEQFDLMTGTSGRYHGLLHSGGRYAVTDPEAAEECILENHVLRRIAPFAMEDTGGLFVATPGDPPEFPAQWAAACAAVGIPAEAVTPDQARAQEPALTERITAAYRVPDATCKASDLIGAFIKASRALGVDVRLFHAVTELIREGDSVVGARLRNTQTGEDFTVRASLVLNTAGPWVRAVAALAGIDVTIRFDRGALVALQPRLINSVINRLRPPSDGDILVPVKESIVLGTTSVSTDRPDDYRIEEWAIPRLLDEAEPVLPAVRETRAVRQWAGVRPLYEPPGAENGSAQGRAVRRTFSVIDHADRDGVGGLITVGGGKLTTCRLMAEQAVDLIGHHLGVAAACTTADEPLPVVDKA